MPKEKKLPDPDWVKRRVEKRRIQRERAVARTLESYKGRDVRIDYKSYFWIDGEHVEGLTVSDLDKMGFSSTAISRRLLEMPTVRMNR